jgi:hypothetical protein
MLLFAARLRRGWRVLAVGGIAASVSLTSALAQVTPVTGALSGSEGIAREGTADDILRNQIDNHMAIDEARFSPGFGSFALGRITSTNHDAYFQGLDSNSIVGTGQSVAFKSFEDSLFAGLAYRTTGGLADSRLSISVYSGESVLHTKLGQDPIDFPGQLTTGRSTNDVWLGGIAATYSVGNLYAAASFTHFSGHTKVDETGNFPDPHTLGTSFGTSGNMVNGAIGDSIEVAKLAGGTRIFLTGEAGLRYIDMDSDIFANRAGDALFSYLYKTTTLSGTIGAFAVVPQGDASLRPFVRLSWLHDTFFDNKTTVYHPDGTFWDSLPFLRRPNDDMGKFEGGVSYVQGSWNVSLSGFGEWAGDQNTIGAKFGLRYDF